MFSLDNKHLVVIGGVTAAVLAGVYVFWGPSESSRRKRNRKGELQFCYTYCRTRRAWR